MHTAGLKSFASHVVFNVIGNFPNSHCLSSRAFTTFANSSFIRVQHSPLLPSLAKRISPSASFKLEQARYLWKSKPPQQRILSPAEEEAGKAAILEKVMKGRQPTDLMLRCESWTAFIQWVLFKLEANLTQVLFWTLKVPQPDLIQAILRKLTKISRKRQNNIWSLQKVWSECRTSIECQPHLHSSSVPPF